MSDVFISYARADRAIAEALAEDLKAKGYRVWWDAELVGSDDFYEVIYQALHDAKAAIVIWTKASAKSKFVRDEARFADHLDKLISVKDTGLTIHQIPFGFQSQHTDDVADREQIVKALEKLGVKPAAARGIVATTGHWAGIAGTDRVDEIVAFLGTNPEDGERRAAIARLKQLTSRPEPAKGQSEFVKSLRATNWQAFLQGLTFQIPRFQLTFQGAWTGVGLACAYALGFLVAGRLILDLLRGLDNTLVKAVFACTIFAGFAYLAWIALGRFVNQKNSAAAGVMAVPFVANAGIAAMTPGLPFGPGAADSVQVPAFVLGLGLSAFAAYRRIVRSG